MFVKLLGRFPDTLCIGFGDRTVAMHHAVLYFSNILNAANRCVRDGFSISTGNNKPTEKEGKDQSLHTTTIFLSKYAGKKLTF